MTVKINSNKGTIKEGEKMLTTPKKVKYVKKYSAGTAIN